MAAKCFFEIDMNTGERLLLTRVYNDAKDMPYALIKYPPPLTNPLRRGRSYTRHGIDEPHGSFLRFRYNYRTYHGQILDGDLVFCGRRFRCPSPAVNSTAATHVDGWNYIEVQRPGTVNWISFDVLRQEARRVRLS